MKIKEIKLYGFKSFQGETKFLLNPGITAFVGPNGSGKSNIFDALRWVFGEQSMKALRCERNEDLIHISADGQNDSNFAEVAVTINNEDFFPQFGSEFEIRRRFYRDGESEFYLNRVKCRLQDIQALFLNSGTLTYSFLELSEIERIISGDTKEMFDDVAGILRYQERREQTNRRLEQTEQDLLRLEDVISEMERTVRALKRQARQTQLYQELRDEYKRLSLIFLKGEYEKSLSELRNAENQVNNLNQQKQAILKKINNLEQERQRLKNEQSVLEAKKKEISAEIYRLNEDIEILQQELARKENEAKQFSLEYERRTASVQEKQMYINNLNNKITEYEDRLRNIKIEIEEWNTKLNLQKEKAEDLSKGFIELTQQIQNKERIFNDNLQKLQILKNDLARLEINKANKESILVRLKREMEGLNENATSRKIEGNQIDKELNAIIEEQEKYSRQVLEKQKNLTDLEEKIANFENDIQKRQDELNECRLLIDTLNNRLGKSENIKELKQKFKEKVAGLLRDCIIVQSGYEAIIDVCLRDALNFHILNEASPEDFEKIPEGRYGFVIKGRKSANEIPEDLNSLKCITGFVEFKTHKEFLSNFLCKFFLTDTFEQALELTRRFPSYGFVTSEGVLFHDNTIIVQKGEFGYFQISQKLSTFQKKAETLQNEIIFIADEKRKLIDQQAQTKLEIEQGKDHLFSLNIKKSELSMQLNTARGQLSNFRKEIEANETERKQINGEVEDISHQIQKHRDEISELEKIQEQIQNEKNKLENDLKNFEEQININNTELNQTILKVSILKESQATQEKNLKDAEAEIFRVKTEIEEISKLSATEQLQLIDHDISSMKQKIQELKERRFQLESQTPEQILEQTTKNLETIYDELTRAQKEQEETQNSIVQVNYTIFELNHKKGELSKKAKEEFQTDLDEYIAEEIPEPEQKLNEVRERMARLGEINPLSLNAYEQEKKRLDEFLVQRNDIIAAKQNLLKSIAELDTRARERFVDTFNEVKDRFNQVFSKFFEGGEADLILTDPSNPLTSDVDIVVRMKGKRIKRINQLSGGERTLLAVSLLLAFYLVKPAPFCILDEIDAPLDDVNVVRFNKFLRELSQHTQVVIITHNRSTMEYADYIYGLTMEKPGQSKIISTRLEDLEPAVGFEN
ncbi:MAG: chromosome segregation protein SMC [bacterium]